MSLWLSADELVEFTGYKRRELQCRALAQLGVAFKARPSDGFPLVLRDHVVPKPAKPARKEPNFEIEAG